MVAEAQPVEDVMVNQPQDGPVGRALREAAEEVARINAHNERLARTPTDPLEALKHLMWQAGRAPYPTYSTLDDLEVF